MYRRLDLPRWSGYALTASSSGLDAVVTNCPHRGQVRTQFGPHSMGQNCGQCRFSGWLTENYRRYADFARVFSRTLAAMRRRKLVLYRLVADPHDLYPGRYYRIPEGIAERVGEAPYAYPFPPAPVGPKWVVLEEND